MCPATLVQSPPSLLSHQLSTKYLRPYRNLNYVGCCIWLPTINKCSTALESYGLDTDSWLRSPHNKEIEIATTGVLKSVINVDQNTHYIRTVDYYHNGQLISYKSNIYFVNIYIYITPQTLIINSLTFHEVTPILIS